MQKEVNMAPPSVTSDNSLEVIMLLGVSARIHICSIYILVQKSYVLIHYFIHQVS
jgi:hypothetical protein